MDKTSDDDIIETNVSYDKKVSSYKFKTGGKEFTLRADAGWSYNPGQYAWNLDVQAYGKIKDLPQKIKDKFISDMAQNPYNKKAAADFIEKSLKKDYKGTTQEITLTWFTPKVIDALKANGAEPITPVVSMKLGKTTHMQRNSKIEKGQALSVSQTKKIPDYLNNPDEIYIDTKDLTVLYIKYLPKDEIIDGRDIIKIPVKINNKNKKLPVNYISTASKIHSTDLKSDKNLKRVK